MKRVDLTQKKFNYTMFIKLNYVPITDYFKKEYKIFFGHTPYSYSENSVRITIDSPDRVVKIVKSFLRVL